MTPVSVIILIHNDEDKIRAALDSVTWADEIVIIDDYSTDQSTRICNEYHVRIVQHKYESYAAQVNWGLQQAKHDWVLVLDSDERITGALRDEMIGVLQHGPDCDGYVIYRQSLFLGELIQYCGWQDDTVTRLFNRHKGQHGVMTDHSDISVDGRLGKLKHKMLHDTYTDFDEYFMKMKRYSDRAALDMTQAKKRVTWVHLTLRPLFRFFKMYLLRFGFMDGRIGLILCGLTAFYVFTKYAKAWHRQKES